MSEYKLRYTPILNKNNDKITRLRHLKYVNSVAHYPYDAKTKINICKSLSSIKKEFFSLKSINKLEVPELQSATSLPLRHLYRLAKGVKRVSLVRNFEMINKDNNGSQEKSLLLMHAKNLRCLEISYEIQDPNFSDYEKLYDTIVAFNKGIPDKQNEKSASDRISGLLGGLNLVVPHDVVFIVDFRIANEVLDYPPVNRLNNDPRNYIMDLAASYFTLNNVQNYYSYKVDSIWNIRKVFLSCNSSNNTLSHFKEFLNKLPNIDIIQLQLTKPLNTEVLTFKDLALLLDDDVKSLKELKNLVIECEGISFDPLELDKIEFPESLQRLELNLRNTNIKNMQNIDYIEQFPNKLKHLDNLQKLKLGLPTTCLVNRMLHNMPSNLKNMKTLLLDFPETSTEVPYEEIYINSYLEWISTMPELTEIFLRTNTLNYTYCAYLPKDELPGGLQKIQFVNESFSNISESPKTVQTKMWIECKKFEDLNVLMHMLSSPELEDLEVPFVFDGLESDLVAIRFLELCSAWPKLKTLRLALGFKIMDEANVESVDNFLSKMNETLKDHTSLKIDLNVYYRKLKGNINVDELNYKKKALKSTKINNLEYIYDLHY